MKAVVHNNLNMEFSGIFLCLVSQEWFFFWPSFWNTRITSEIPPVTHLWNTPNESPVKYTQWLTCEYSLVKYTQWLTCEIYPMTHLWNTHNDSLVTATGFNPHMIHILLAAADTWLSLMPASCIQMPCLDANISVSQIP